MLVLRHTHDFERKGGIFILVGWFSINLLRRGCELLPASALTPREFWDNASPGSQKNNSPFRPSAAARLPSPPSRTVVEAREEDEKEETRVGQGRAGMSGREGELCFGLP